MIFIWKIIVIQNNFSFKTRRTQSRATSKILTYVDTHQTHSVCRHGFESKHSIQTTFSGGPKTDDTMSVYGKTADFQSTERCKIVDTFLSLISKVFILWKISNCLKYLIDFWFIDWNDLHSDEVVNEASHFNPGHYMMFSSNVGQQGDRVQLMSKLFKSAVTKVVRFRYYMEQTVDATLPRWMCFERPNISCKDLSCSMPPQTPTVRGSIAVPFACRPVLIIWHSWPRKVNTIHRWSPLMTSSSCQMTKYRAYVLSRKNATEVYLIWSKSTRNVLTLYVDLRNCIGRVESTYYVRGILPIDFMLQMSTASSQVVLAGIQFQPIRTISIFNSATQWTRWSTVRLLHTFD